MNISVELMHSTPLEVAIKAIRQCYESQDKSDSGFPEPPKFSPYVLSWKLGERDKALIERIIKSGHTSTLEHISFNFQIKGISRLNLQELARHRMASLSVKSTRYTIQELKKETCFNATDNYGNLYNKKDSFDRASKYINFTGIENIDIFSIEALENLRRLVELGSFTNDQVKYALPECYRLDLVWTINLRSLRNFLQLRTSPKAHFEIRELAQKIYDAIPEVYKFMVDDVVYKEAA